MSALSPTSPFPTFTDIDGNPLEGGYIYIGTAGLNPETNLISVYWDATLAVPATQPIRTLGGYPSRSGSVARVYVNADDCSMLVRNKNGTLIFSALNQTTRVPSNLVMFTQTGTGTVTRTAQDKMQEVMSAKDFGAVEDGVTDDAAALTLAIASNRNVTLPESGLYFNSVITVTGASDVTLSGGRLIFGPLAKIAFVSCTDVVIEGVKMSRPVVSSTASSLTFTTCTRVLIDGIRHTTTGAASYFNHTVIGTYVNTTDFTLQNSYIEYSVLGFDAKAYVRSNILNNTFRCVGTVGAMEAIKHNEGTFPTVEDNIIFPTKSTVAPDICSGITMESGSFDAAVTNNKVYCTNAGVYTLRIANTYASAPARHKYLGNILRTFDGTTDAIIGVGLTHEFRGNSIYGRLNASNPANAASPSERWVIADNAFLASGIENIRLTDSTNFIIRGNEFLGGTRAIFKDGVGANHSEKLWIVNNVFSLEYTVGHIYAIKATALNIFRNTLDVDGLAVTSMDIQSCSGKVYNNTFLGVPLAQAINASTPITAVYSYKNDFPDHATTNLTGTGITRLDVIKQTVGTAAPAAGFWSQGSICWNQTPGNAAGQPIGWVCVVAGTPGTWRVFGVTV